MSKINDLDELQHRLTLLKPVNDERVKCVNCAHSIWDYSGVECWHELNDSIVLKEHSVYTVDTIILVGLDKSVEFDNSGDVAKYCSEFEIYKPL